MRLPPFLRRFEPVAAPVITPTEAARTLAELATMNARERRRYRMMLMRQAMGMETPDEFLPYSMRKQNG